MLMSMEVDVNIVIYGKGVTGFATGTMLENAGCAVFYNDPPKGIHVSAGVEPDWVFICVPTPTGDLSYVRAAARDAAKKYEGVPIVIRSTVPPGTHDILCKDNPQADFVMMPEFLREKTAVEDALRKDRAVFAAPNVYIASRFYRFLLDVGFTGIQEVSVAEAELIKFLTNGLIAVKVAFANVIYSLAQATGADYQTLLSLLEADGRFGMYGLKVPGDHGLGYAGMCLPKDMGWLKLALEQYGIDLGADVIQGIQDYNTELRARQHCN